MTPTEIRDWTRKFAKSIGPQAEVFTYISSCGKPVHGSLYVNGMVRDVTVGVDADTFPEMMTLLEAAWSTRRDEHRQKTVRKMALEIIRLTAEYGAATDAALRSAGFDQTEIDAVGAEAVADANEIASNGPFEIASVANANAA